MHIGSNLALLEFLVFISVEDLANPTFMTSWPLFLEHSGVRTSCPFLKGLGILRYLLFYSATMDFSTDYTSVYIYFEDRRNLLVVLF